MEKKEPISLQAYDELAEYYFSYVDTKPYNAYYERPGTLALMPAVQGKVVLDAGCAAGWYTHWLLEQGATVTAVDFSSNMVEMTRKRVDDRAIIHQADLNEPLDFLPDATFDVVVSSLVLHYLKDWDAVFAEIARVLKPGGQFVFSIHHPFMDFTIFERENYFLTELLEDDWTTPHGNIKVNFYRRPLREVIRPLVNAGFIIEALDEPMPTEQFRESNPKAYDKLTKRPQFLFIRASKG